MVVRTSCLHKYSCRQDACTTIREKRNAFPSLPSGGLVARSTFSLCVKPSCLLPLPPGEDWGEGRGGRANLRVSRGYRGITPRKRRSSAIACWGMFPVGARGHVPLPYFGGSFSFLAPASAGKRRRYVGIDGLRFADPSYNHPIPSESQAVLPDDVPVPLRRSLGDAAAGWEIDIIQAETLGIPAAPFEIVQERPNEIALQANAFL